jgi:hypothetical protein
MPLIINNFSGNDLEYMINNDIYQNALYLYYDSIEELCAYNSGKFSSLIRQYNRFNPKNKYPKSAGIPIANRKKGGFQKLTKQISAYIDLAFNDIQELIDIYQYDNIIISIRDGKPYNQLYCIADDVSDYILKKVNSLKLN